MGETATEIGGEVMVTVAVAVLVESAELIAVTVTVLGLGTIEGAVYRPETEIVPIEAEPPVVPFTCHVTARFVALNTVAENCKVAPVCTLPEVGEIVIETTGAGGVGTVVGELLPLQPKAAAQTKPSIQKRERR